MNDVARKRVNYVAKLLKVTNDIPAKRCCKQKWCQDICSVFILTLDLALLH